MIGKMNGFNTLIITHGSCQDGTCSAWILRKYLSSKEGCRIQYVFATKRNLLKDIHPLTLQDLKEKDIYVLDYSYQYEELKGIEYKSITLIDHHKGAQEEMEKCKALPNSKIVFSLDKCGAGLTWECFFTEEMPWWIQYIQDRDLWVWKLPESRAINDALYNLGYRTFAKFDELQQFTEKDRQEFIEKGKKIGDVKTNIVNSIASTSHICMFEGYRVCVCETSVLPSEVGEELYRRSIVHPENKGQESSITSVSITPGDKQLREYEFVILFSYNFKEKHYSVHLRSESMDVNTIAKKYGGGGHVGAAGFKYDGNLLACFSDIPK